MRVGAILLALQSLLAAYYLYATVSVLLIPGNRLAPDDWTLAIQQATWQGVVAAVSASLAVLSWRGFAVALWASVTCSALASAVALFWAAIGMLWGPVVGLLFLVVPMPFSGSSVLTWATLAVFLTSAWLYRNQRPSPAGARAP